MLLCFNFEKRHDRRRFDEIFKSMILHGVMSLSLIPIKLHQARRGPQSPSHDWVHSVLSVSLNNP